MISSGKADNEKTFDEVRANWRAVILDAYLPDVEFDGWSDAGLKRAANRLSLPDGALDLAFPRGLLDALIEFHRAGDREMVAALPSRIAMETSMTRKVEAAILLRLEIAKRHKEAVRKAASYWALPQHSAQGGRLLWETANAIWRALGVEDRGFSHYSRRASLAAVFSSTFLYWLQDNEPDLIQTKAFLARRLEDLGQIGKLSAQIKAPFLRKTRNQ